jgi:hypothetical protein
MAKQNKQREHRITEEIVVDAYGAEEKAMGWYYYLEERLCFPFRARCITHRAISPLRKGQEVEVVGLAPHRRMRVRNVYRGDLGKKNLGRSFGTVSTYPGQQGDPTSRRGLALLA